MLAPALRHFGCLCGGGPAGAQSLPGKAASMQLLRGGKHAPCQLVLARARDPDAEPH